MKRIIAVIIMLCTLILLVSCGGAREPREVRTIEINENGELIVIFTDGTKSNAGVVKGEKGDAGENGEDGRDGVDGKDGRDGEDGKDGEKGDQGLRGTEGRDGRSIESVEVDAEGRLVIEYDDGKTDTLELVSSLCLFGGFLNDERTVAWALYSGGVLMIGGEGSTYDYREGEAPWTAVIPMINLVYVNYTEELVLDGELLYGIDPEIIIYSERAPETTAMWVDMAVEAPVFATAEDAVAPDGKTPVAMLPLGTKIDVTKLTDEYAEIYYNDQYVYIARKYVRDNDGSVVFNTPVDFMQIEVTGAGGAALRIFPDTVEAEAYATLPKGSILNCTGISVNKNWYRVSYEGNTLYVYKTVVTPVTEA